MGRVVVALLLVLVPLAKASPRLPVQVALSVTDLHSGRAILSDGRLVSTGDGFLHWQASLRLTVPVHDLAAVDRYHAFAVAVDGRLHRTVDGGKSWATIVGAPRLDGIVAADSSHLFATTQAGRLATSADGGTSWRVRSLTGVHSLCAVDASHVLATRRGEIVRSADGGGSFVTAFRVPNPRLAHGSLELTCARGGVWATLDDLGAASSQSAYVVLESPDGGRRWIPRVAEQYFSYWPAVRTAAEGPPQVPVIAPGSPSGAVLAGGCSACNAGVTIVMATRDGGRKWSGVWQGVTPPNVPPVLDNAEPLAIDFVDARDGWLMIGPTYPGSPRILRTADGGRTWAFLAEL